MWFVALAAVATEDECLNGHVHHIATDVYLKPLGSNDGVTAIRQAEFNAQGNNLDNYLDKYVTVTDDDGNLWPDSAYLIANSMVLKRSSVVGLADPDWYYVHYSSYPDNYADNATNITIGAVVALLLAFVVHLVLTRSRFGFQLRTVGLNPVAAARAGIPQQAMVVLALTMSLPPWLGRCYGAGDWPQIRRLMALAFKVAVLWQLALGGVLALFAPWVAMALSGNPEVRGELSVLIRGLLPSYALLGLCMLVVSASNALGWPLRAMLLSCARLFACYLPCLWLGTQWGGIAGTALGAAIGNGLAGGLAYLMFRRSIDERGRRTSVIN